MKLAFLLLMAFLSVAQAQAQIRLRVATTTSVQDTGLMPYLLPEFEKKCGCKVDLIAVGSGQALKFASNGDVDMVLVHDPASEKQFVEKGFGINRRTIMMNDFVILGPDSDPAHIKGMTDAARAFLKIRETASTFVSRGDESGTNQKENSLWKKSGIRPSGSWYLEVGQGMGAVLTIAGEKQGYTLCDRGTFLSRINNLALRVLVEGDPDLLNYYSAIQVNPARFPSVKSGLAAQLVDWLCSREGQKRIGDFTINGHTLFKPIYSSGK